MQVINRPVAAVAFLQDLLIQHVWLVHAEQSTVQSVYT